ncbi:hypothetical protein C8J35_101934 [Rhizobium sp. PP-F2F-G38]|nr:hypothetical protein C8J37_101920 [Rhizobium sp. PP-WC-1G-195]PYF01109.1 hypothetical protein C8J35_101934 [Rhizobium sp. PP-F2F-G38]
MVNRSLDTDISRWIRDKIPTLNNRSKYRADNALRFLSWAEEFKTAAPPVASFCTIHAVEEAVAAFISAAKSFGHTDRAKTINIHDHLSKALVSIFASRASLAVSRGSLAIAVHPDKDSLAYRLPKADGFIYDRLHLSAFQVEFDADTDVSSYEFLGHVPLLEEIDAEVKKVTAARNGVLYASDKGSPVGFLDIETEIGRATGLTFGLIWGSIDLHRDPAQGGTFVQMMMDKMIEINTTRQNLKKSNTK